jgi:hypothetical protein
MEQTDFLTALLGPLTPLVVAGLLGTAVSEIVDWVKAPLVKRFPEADFWYFVYVNGALGAIVGWFSTVNLFALVMPNEILGRLLTAAMIGGGSTLIYRVFKREAPSA